MQKESFNTEENLEIIKHLERIKRICGIYWAAGIRNSPHCGFCRQRCKINVYGWNNFKYCEANNNTAERNRRYERLSSMWLEDQTVSNLSFSQRESTYLCTNTLKETTVLCRMPLLALAMIALVVSNIADPGVWATWLFSQKKMIKKRL